MRNVWTVALLLGMGAVAVAQESRFNLLNETDMPEFLTSGEDQDKKKDQETEFKIYAGKLQDEMPVGESNKPMWTLHRVSPQTRIYLQVESGEVEFEQWLDIRLQKKRSQADDRVRMSEEFEFGLGYRLQLDIYMNTIYTRNGVNSTLAIRSWAAEVRYALADWGVIPGNPTLYLEYILWNNQPDGHGDEATSSIEPKLLLGGEIATGWHWGSNFFYERTLNDSVKEHGVTASLLHTVVDKLLTVGVTAKAVYEVDAVSTQNNKVRSRELYLGPSFQVRLAPYKTEMESEGKKVPVTRTRAHLDLEPIFGLTGQSNRAQVLIVFGWDF